MFQRMASLNPRQLPTPMQIELGRNNELGMAEAAKGTVKAHKSKSSKGKTFWVKEHLRFYSKGSKEYQALPPAIRKFQDKLHEMYWSKIEEGKRGELRIYRGKRKAGAKKGQIKLGRKYDFNRPEDARIIRGIAYGQVIRAIKEKAKQLGISLDAARLAAMAAAVAEGRCNVYTAFADFPISSSGGENVPTDEGVSGVSADEGTGGV